MDESDKKIRLTIDLELYGDYGAFSEDDEEKDWFYNHLLGDDLILHSSLVGDEIGKVHVVRVHNVSHGGRSEDKTNYQGHIDS